MRRDQIRTLRDAGVTRLQPGIESLSTSVLRLMRKGVSGLQNVRLLKWCQAHGIHPVWNALFGFPGEPPEEYERLARLVPLLTHLTPPEYAGSLRLDRFSPYFEDPDAFGITGIEPYPAYREVYDLPAPALRNLAYYFCFETGGESRDLGYVEPFRAAVAKWREVHASSELIGIDDGAFTLVCDYRPVAEQAVTVLGGRERAALLACDDIRTAAQVRAALADAGDDAADVDAILAELLARKLLIAENEAYLSIVVDLRFAKPSLLEHINSARAAFAAPR